MKLAENLYAYPWTQPTANNCNTFHHRRGLHDGGPRPRRPV